MKKLVIISIILCVIILNVKLVDGFDKILILKTNNNLKNPEIPYLVENFNTELKIINTIKDGRIQLERTDIDLIYVTMHGSKNGKLLLNNGRSILNLNKVNISTNCIFSSCEVFKDFKIQVKPNQLLFGYTSLCFEDYSKNVLIDFLKLGGTIKAWRISNIKYNINSDYKIKPVVFRGINFYGK